MYEAFSDAYAYVFGREKTARELVRDNRRLIDRGIRELDRERSLLQSQETKLVNELRSLSRSGTGAAEPAIRMMARDLVRTRAAVANFGKLKMQMQSVSLRMQTIQGTHAMGAAMTGVTRALGVLNARLGLPRMQRIMMEFEKQNQKAEDSAEIMGDTIDGAFCAEDETEATDELVAQVLDEIGCTVRDEFATPIPTMRVEAAASGGTGGPSATQGARTGATPAAVESDGTLSADLEARLENLRK
jgi:charged multivesicular body protein 2A